MMYSDEGEGNYQQKMSTRWGFIVWKRGVQRRWWRTAENGGVRCREQFIEVTILTEDGLWGLRQANHSSEALNLMVWRMKCDRSKSIMAADQQWGLRSTDLHRKVPKLLGKGAVTISTWNNPDWAVKWGFNRADLTCKVLKSWGTERRMKLTISNRSRWAPMWTEECISQGKSIKRGGIGCGTN